MRTNSIYIQPIYILLATFCLSCSNVELQHSFIPVQLKQKGAHVFGQIDSSNIQQFHDMHINWITLVPYGSQADIDSPEVRHSRGDSTQMLKRNRMWLDQIKTTRDAGYKVFFKPHIWMHQPTSGKWRSDIYPENEVDWATWKESYKEFILRYARIAEQGGVEMFCVGAELTRLTKEKPEFWNSLIQDLRTVYSGKLTYAANWYEEYEQIEFWNALDYIGIQAYFPLSKEHKPTIENISAGWQNYSSKMAKLSKKYNRPILFTELGYKSTSNSAVKPWEWLDYEEDTSFEHSEETQVNCYQAFFNSIWQKPWFAGVHIWQMRVETPKASKWHNLDFTPKGKPAEMIMRKGFSKK